MMTRDSGLLFWATLYIGTKTTLAPEEEEEYLFPQ